MLGNDRISSTSFIVVQNLLQTNHIGHVRLFDADPLALQSMSGTVIRVSIEISNEMLRELNSSLKARPLGVGYISVGDEPFHLIDGQQFYPFVVGAASNIQLALTEATFSKRVKLTVPCDSDVYVGGYNSSSLPLTGVFRSDLNKTMTHLLKFLQKHYSPFTIGINLFLELEQNPNFTMKHALFEQTSHHN
ncbi:Beta-1,3-endoglucanase, family GH17 [Zostera marina]|uniref:Beta-1,3-endoglucanase, family GH17 n=1 Tax=Zostera marina TaxID=29655 RepID=A0A0K9PS87_ZOSMR|nr:Beta-1,3-endoglucanase, family GH17 [Zostera marina]